MTALFTYNIGIKGEHTYMSATFEKLDNNRVSLKIEVATEDLGRAIEAGYRAVAKQVNIPGFRKGKAPKSVIQAYVGKEAVYKEALDKLIPSAYGNAVQETGIVPVDYPKVSVEHFEEGEPLVFTATVQCVPEVTLGQYKGFDVAPKEFSVTDEDVETEIVNMQARLGSVESTDRVTVEKGDLVTLDFIGKIEDEPFEGGTAEGFDLEIGSGTLIPGFEDQLVGASLEEPTVVSVVFPSDYPNTELAGTAATFDVTIKSIKAKVPAPFDEAFMKRFGEYEGAEAFKVELKKRLIEGAEKRASSQFDDEILAKVAENSAVEVPQVMVERRIDTLVKDFERQLTQQQRTLKEYYEVTGSEESDLRSSLQERAAREVKMDLVLDAVTAAEGVEATADDVEAKIAEMATGFGVSEETVMASFKGEESIRNLKERIVREKTVSLLLGGYEKVVAVG